MKNGKKKRDANGPSFSEIVKELGEHFVTFTKNSEHGKSPHWMFRHRAQWMGRWQGKNVMSSSQLDNYFHRHLRSGATTGAARVILRSFHGMIIAFPVSYAYAVVMDLPNMIASYNYASVPFASVIKFVQMQYGASHQVIFGRTCDDARVVAILNELLPSAEKVIRQSNGAGRDIDAWLAAHVADLYYHPLKFAGIVLMSGDGDLSYSLQRRWVTDRDVVVISTKKTLSHELSRLPGVRLDILGDVIKPQSKR